MSQILKYRKKIKSVKNIAKITRAMQMISASKMKRAQDLASKGKIYSDEIYSLASEIAPHIKKETHPLLNEKAKNTDSDLVVLIAPEKGLCGSLITNLYKKIGEIVKLNNLNAKKFIVVGRKGSYLARIFKADILAEFSLGLTQPSYEIVPPIARIISDEFLNGNIGKVIIIFSEFISTLEYEIKFRNLLPIVDFENASLIDESGQKETSFVFEPSSEMIADGVFSMYLETAIYQAILDSFASEQSARMIAMKNATDNAKELVSELTLTFNKERQMSVTSEILDINSAVSMLTTN